LSSEARISIYNPKPLYKRLVKKFFTIFTLKLIAMKTNDYVNGLLVKDGRLINDRKDGESGIARAASMKRAVDNDRKVNQIAEGIQLAEDKKNFRQLEY